MIIHKLSNNSYELSEIKNITVIANLLDLFAIKNQKKNDSSLEILQIEKVETFAEWRKNLKHPKIDFFEAELLFKNFAAISLYLEKNNLQFSHLNIHELIVINNNFFIPLNTENLFDIKDMFIEIINPYEKENIYLPLELKNNSSIPLKIHFKVFYFSFSLLIYDLLIGLDESDFNKGLLIIYMTKLYWLLLNCLTKKPEDRIIINI
tara:strand:- start:5559 stop:6179 length:621 start_codon:yes stop_codon:yes gene_type:complete